ncbi:uncharacterized protein [Periplaneta americana]|uniref:uncharacterized protein isoform X2 n=1 Tax=Periplaneta americana TaxID=6978 RepID=UPI0037E73558
MAERTALISHEDASPQLVDFNVMLQRGHHDRLLDLALEAIGEFVTDVCLQLLKLPQSKGDDKTSAMQMCRNLQEMLHSTIPYSLANESTAKLLKCIDSLSSDIEQWSAEPWNEPILQELISAIIHPAVTSIELSSDSQHIFPFGFKWNFLIPLVYSRLHTLNDLRALRLGRPQCEGWVVDNVNISEHLEEFTFIHMCNDKVLVDLAKLCKSLKCLNVSESRNITDRSIETILKIERLEELNVIGTCISEVGLTRLLNGLAKKQENFDVKSKCRTVLKSFGCSYITYSQSKLLASKFPSLVEVRLSHCGVCDLNQLKILKNLRKLSLRSVKFSQIQELLYEIGSQLVHLDLRHVQSLDVRFIGEMCVALKNFHLFSYGVLQPSLEHYDMELLPGFQSVSCLEFDCDWNRQWTDYILTQCTNVRKVDVTAHRKDTYLLLKHVLISNPMKKLEKLCWSPTSPDGENIAKQLADQCPNLTEVKGLCKKSMNYRGVQLLP